jgi:hypothetical protein
MESEFVTVITFNHAHEMLTARALLETRGIECFTRDELTAQTATYYAFAVGGIKLQVRQQDVERALRILIDAGYLNEKALESAKPTFDIDQFTSKFPIFKKRSFRILLFVSLILFVGGIAAIVYRVSLPSALEVLTQNKWYLANVMYKYEDYNHQTDQANFFTGGSYEGCITFYSDGTIILPGFNSGDVRGKWELLDDQLHIVVTDTFDFFYNGVYEVDFDKEFLDLKSEKTTLSCYVRDGWCNF